MTISGELEARGIPTSLRQAAEDFAKAAPRSREEMIARSIAPKKHGI